MTTYTGLAVRLLNAENVALSLLFYYLQILYILLFFSQQDVPYAVYTQGVLRYLYYPLIC